MRSEYALVKIAYSDILYLETMDDYIRIHKTNNESVLTLSSMSKILKKLPENDFCRVHRSYSVSLSKIDSVKNNKIMIGEYKIPVGTSYKDDFMKKYHLK